MNYDFGLGVAQRAQDAQRQDKLNTYQMLMDAANSYKDNQRYKDQKALQERQLDLQEQKLNAPAAFNLKRNAETALMKANLGEQLSPQDMAAIQSYDMLQREQVIAGPGGYMQTIKPPSLMDKLGSLYRTDGINPEAYQEGSFLDLPGLPVQGGDFADDIQDPEAFTNAVLGKPQQSSGLPQVYEVSPYMDNSPDAEMEKLKANVDVGKEATIMELENQMEQKKLTQEKKREAPKADVTFQSYMDDFTLLDNKIDQAMELTNNFTAGVGSLSSFLPGTDAKDLEALITTINSDAAFGRLQQMRDQSKTGGALGNVSERELGLLQSARTSLMQSQSPEQLKKGFWEYKVTKINALHNTAEAFKADYGFYPNGYTPPTNNYMDELKMANDAVIAGVDPLKVMNRFYSRTNNGK